MAKNLVQNLPDMAGELKSSTVKLDVYVN